MVDLVRNPIVTPILRAGAVGPEGYFQGKALRRQDTIGDMQLQNLKRIERAKINFAKNKDFWDSVGSAPPEMIGQDDTNPIQDFTPLDGPAGSQGRPFGFEADQTENEIMNNLDNFDVFDIGTGYPYQAVNPIQPPPALANEFAQLTPPGVSQKDLEKSNKTAKNLADNRIAQLEKHFKTINKDWVNNPKSGMDRVLSEAFKLDLDPAAAIAIFAIETDFGGNVKTSGKNAKGLFQVTDATARQLTDWFSNQDNIKRYNIPQHIVDYAKEASREYYNRGSSGQKSLGGNAKMGLLRLKYNEIIGVPKDLWGAAYQGNADSVKQRGMPLPAWDDTLTNYDYNSAYISIYNSIQQPGSVYNLFTTNVTPFGGMVTHGIQSSGPIGSTAGKPAAGGLGDVIPAIPPSEGMTADSAKRIADLNAAFAKQAGLPPPQAAAGVQPPSGAAGSGTTQIDTSGKTADGGSTATQSGTAIGSQADTSGTSEETKKAISAIEQFGGLKSSKDIKPPSIAQYKDKPAAIGRDIAELMKQRTRAYELSQIARFSGDIEGALNAVGSIQELDARLYYAHGMQGIRDLEYGDTLRASRVWSDFLSAGTDPNRIQIRIRQDGNYNVYDAGKLIHEGVSLDSLSKRARLVFDQGYRDKLSAAESDMASKMFENQLKILLKDREILATLQKEVTVERQKGLNKLLEEKLKAKLGKDDIKVTPSGNGIDVIITQGGKTYILNTQTQEITEGPFAGMPIPNQAVEVPMIGANNANAWATALGQN